MSHEEQVTKLENTVAEHKRGSVPTKGLALQNYREKEAYLQYEVCISLLQLLHIFISFLFFSWNAIKLTFTFSARTSTPTHPITLLTSLSEPTLRQRRQRWAKKMNWNHWAVLTRTINRALTGTVTERLFIDRIRRTLDDVLWEFSLLAWCRLGELSLSFIVLSFCSLVLLINDLSNVNEL